MGLMAHFLEVCGPDAEVLWKALAITVIDPELATHSCLQPVQVECLQGRGAAGGSRSVLFNVSNN